MENLHSYDKILEYPHTGNVFLLFLFQNLGIRRMLYHKYWKDNYTQPFLMQYLNSTDSIHECILKRMIKRIKKKALYCISKRSKWNDMVVNGKRFHTKPSILINAQGSVIWLIPSDSSFREQVSCNWGQRNRLWQCQECISESLILQ